MDPAEVERKIKKPNVHTPRDDSDLPREHPQQLGRRGRAAGEFQGPPGGRRPARTQDPSRRRPDLQRQHGLGRPGHGIRPAGGFGDVLPVQRTVRPDRLDARRAPRIHRLRTTGPEGPRRRHAPGRCHRRGRAHRPDRNDGPSGRGPRPGQEAGPRPSPASRASSSIRLDRDEHHHLRVFAPAPASGLAPALLAGLAPEEDASWALPTWSGTSTASMTTIKRRGRRGPSWHPGALGRPSVAGE